MMDPVSIRPMTARDLPRVMAIERDSYTTPWGETTFEGLLRRADADLLVAETDDEVVGYAVFWVVLDEGELGNIAVAAPWRRKGIAARLLDAVIWRAQSRQARRVYLEVRESNRVARHLYEAHGFEEVGRRRGYYQSPVEDAIVMARPVADGGREAMGGG